MSRLCYNTWKKWYAGLSDERIQEVLQADGSVRLQLTMDELNAAAGEGVEGNGRFVEWSELSGRELDRIVEGEAPGTVLGSPVLPLHVSCDHGWAYTQISGAIGRHRTASLQSPHRRAVKHKTEVALKEPRVPPLVEGDGGRDVQVFLDGPLPAPDPRRAGGQLGKGFIEEPQPQTSGGPKEATIVR